MKKILSLSLILSVFILAMIGCKKDSVTATGFDGNAIDNYDLVQVTNANTNMFVTFSLTGDKYDSVVIYVYPQGTNITKAVTKKVIKTVSAVKTDVVTSIPFPSTAAAPTGTYTVDINMYNGSSVKKQKVYQVNLQNNQTQDFCDIPTTDLPAGANTWIKLYSTLPVPATEDVYITGSFEADNGGGGNWTGGASKFKMIRLSSTCFYIALNLTTAHEFKFTNGSWPTESLLNDGGTPENAKWNGKPVQTFIRYNWKGKTIVNQPLIGNAQALPNNGIKFGAMSVVADVYTLLDTAQYFLVKKGGDLADKTYPMYRISGTTKVVGAVPKDASAQYYVVRGGKVGVSLYGFDKTVAWDGKTNPVSVKTPFFKGDAGIQGVPANLFIVGDATPGSWDNPVPVPSQQFIKVPNTNTFELTLTLNAGASYLFLPVNGDWGHKFGGKEKTGGPLLADNEVPGSNTPSPDVKGSYKITVDFEKEVYTVTKL